MKEFRFDDPDQYLSGTPYEALAQLRATKPFAWHPASDPLKKGFWIATKHCDVVSIAKRPDIFATNSPLLGDPVPESLWELFPSLGMIANNLMTFEHQKHLRFRTIANPIFSGPRNAMMEAITRSICNEVLDRVSDRSQYDFAEDVALVIPVRVILGLLLGVPERDLTAVTRYVLTINAMDDPVFRPRRESLVEAAEALFDYGMTLLKRIKSSAGTDLLKELVHISGINGVSIEEFFLAYWFPLAAGAFDTTASTIAGGVKALLEFPEQLSLIQREPTLIPSAVEEMIRWVSPVVYFCRTARSKVMIRENQIKEGEKIVLCFASANRDEDVFESPDCFNVGRTPNPHLSFGYGPHFCLGARISSTILRIFLEEASWRLATIRPNGEVVRTRSGWMNRIRSMPVRNSEVTGARYDSSWRRA